MPSSRSISLAAAVNLHGLLVLAHELRTNERVERMATKIRIMKMLQEIRGFAQITNRRPSPKSPGLFLVQLRAHVARTTFPRRKLIIPVVLHGLPDIPHPVKIKVKADSVRLATPPSP